MKKCLFLVILFILFNNLLVYSQYNTSILEGTHKNAFTKVGAPSIYSDRTVLNKVATSDFQIIYDTPAPPIPAQNAIEEAVKIWKYLINTNISQNIKILVKWEDLGYSSTESYTLAKCGATSYYNSTSLPQNVQYPIALAEFLLDQNLNHVDSNEINLWVNSNDSVKWYYGLDGVPQENKTDMISVILHEIAHGLGFGCTFKVTGDLGWQGTNGYPLDPNLHPEIYDRFCVIGSYYPNADRLINYPDSSIQLKEKLISDNVYFNGDNAWIQNGRNLLPKLFAPTSFELGSSISHLDGDTYLQGNTNSLMTPAIDMAEVIHSPGEVGLAILKDIGWNINRLATFIHPEPGVALQKGTIDTIKWMDNEGGSYSLVLLDSLNNFVMTICTLGTADEGLNGYIWTVPSGIPNGKYRIKEQFGTAHGITGTFTITDQQQVAQPQLSHITGTYIDPITVTASCETPNATIRYTINSADEPSPSSPIFPSALICSTFTTIRVKAFKDGMIPSLTTVATYNFGTDIPEPTVSLPSGDYPQGTKLTISWPYGYDCWRQENHNNTEPPTPESQGGGQYLIPNPRTEILYNANEIWHMKFQLYKDGKWGPVVYVIYNLKPALRIAQIDDEITGEDDSFGFWNKWESNQWQPHTDETIIRPTTTSDWFLQAQQSYKDGTFRKYNVWSKNTGENYFVNHAQIPIGPTTSSSLAHFKNTFDVTVKNNLENSISMNQGIFYFKDPWFIDDNSDSKGLRNRGTNPLPVEMSYQTTPNITTGSTHKGVFLNQPFNDPNKPYYSVKANQTQSINLGGNIGTRNFYFQNWSGSNSTFQNANVTETGVVFTNDNAIASANFKGTQLSSENNVYTNTSQRKFIRLHNNEMMHVYNSMNKAWLETSTDNGTTWQLRNNGKPLTQQESKLPSVCQIGQSYIIIALQERKIDSGYNIKIIIYDLASDMIVAEGIAANPGNKLYTEDANPVVACPREGIQNFLLVWEEAHYGEFQPAGLYYRYGKLVSGPSVSWISYTDLITGTDLDTHVPALVADFSDNEYPLYYRLAYEQHSSGNISAIHYRNISASATTVTVPSATNISANAGFSKNTKPSLIAASNGARISWIGYRVIEEEGEGMDKKTANILGKVNADIETEQKVVFNDPTNLSVYWNFGANVQSTSINKSNDCYSIAWGRSNTLPIQFADSYTLSSIFTIGDLIGKDVQLSNGTTRTTMKAMAFNSNSQPYYFNNKQLYLSKVNLADIGSGREGVVSKDSAQFYFAIGDIKVNDQLVKFVEFDDSVSFYSNQRLNEFLLSEPFILTNNTNFTYSVQYGITDSAAAVNTLDNDDFINFKVELIDNQSGELLGLFDDITYTKANADQYENIAYQVNTEGIGNRTVRLRLVTANNFDPKYSLTDRYAEGNALLKSSFKQVSFQGSLKVDNYDLSQNYPNPFNPTTTINYQIKEDGLVTLKIYDILGAEIKTLVNEEKSKGRYTYNFDGSSLASGVYIYQLKVNDFVASKKLMLLK